MCQRSGCQWAASSHNKTKRLPCRGCPSGRLLAKRHRDVGWIRSIMAFSDGEMVARGARPLQEVQSTSRQAGAEVPGAVDESPRAEDGHSEEDPFGHMQAGFDDSPPEPVPQALSSQAERAASSDHRNEVADHVIRTRGAAAWCEVCGRWALARVGSGLTGKCKGVLGSYGIRRARLRAGRHPLTGNLL